MVAFSLVLSWLNYLGLNIMGWRPAWEAKNGAFTVEVCCDDGDLYCAPLLLHRSDVPAASGLRQLASCAAELPRPHNSDARPEANEMDWQKYLMLGAAFFALHFDSFCVVLAYFVSGTSCFGTSTIGIAPARWRAKCMNRGVSSHGLCSLRWS